MRYLRLLLPIVLASAAATGYGQSTAQESGKRELLEIHQADRQAHFQHDIKSLLAGMGDEFIDVHDGTIRHLNRENVRAHFADYFQRSQFTAWDDVEPPIVRVSRDGSMGWMIVRVRITYKETKPSGESAVHDSIMAWMSAYEKQNGKWILTAITSTSGPEKVSP